MKRMNKKAQFFILSAVIIASIIVSMVSIKNSASTAAVPSKFYYFSQQLEQETGAVVDYALYSQGGTTTITDFLQQGITKTKGSYPDMDIYACYSGLNPGEIWCQNNGTKSINITSSCNSLVTEQIVPTGTPPICPERYLNSDGSCMRTLTPAKSKIYLIVDCPNPYLNFTINNYTTKISINPTAMTSGQFYLVFRMNTTAGELAADSNHLQNGAGTSSSSP